MLNFLITILLFKEVFLMKKRRKHYLKASLQIYIEVKALEISLKEITIDDVPDISILRDLVLEDCRLDYHCDGYGNPLPNGEASPTEVQGEGENTTA